MTRSNIYSPIPEMKAALARLKGQAPAVVAKALAQAGENIVSEAMADGVVPFKDGHLQASHRAEMQDDGQRVDLVAGIEYALAVHERHPTKKHWFLNTVTGIGPKAVEAALEAAMKGVR